MSTEDPVASRESRAQIRQMLLIGAVATGIGHFGSNYSASSAGRKWLLGGMGAAILSGLSWTIATTLYNATGG